MLHYRWALAGVNGTLLLLYALKPVRSADLIIHFTHVALAKGLSSTVRVDIKIEACM